MKLQWLQITMLPQELSAVLLLMLLSVSQAEVYQINTSRTLCTREEVVFICSNNNGPVIRCAATTVTGVHVSLGLHSKFTKLQEARIDSTSVRGEVIDANSSYFVTTITVVPPVSSTIVCNDETISYHLQNYSQLIPAQLNLTPQENTSDYIITWTPDWSNSTHYIVTVTPNSPDETTETITSTALATLSLNKTVTYNITVSFMECPDLYNTTFVFDCSLTLPSSLQGIYYTTNMNGNWIAQAASITPTANEVVNVSCNNGTWTSYFESSSSSSTNSVPAINLIATIPASNSLDTEITSLKARQNNVNELWISVIAVCTTLIGIMFGIAIGILLGIACGFKMQQKMTKKRNEINYSIDVPGQTATEESTPVYEDVQFSENKDSIELSPNLAYEAVKLNK